LVKALLIMAVCLSSVKSYGQAFCYNDVAPINDYATTSRSIVVSGTIGTIADLTVYVDIEHTYIWDLTISLTSPNGTVVTLYDQNCGDENTRYQNIQTFFDDGGSPIVCPLTGLGFTIPVDSLSAFDGQSMNGTWTISVYDNEAGDFGYLYVCCLYAKLDLDEGCPLSVTPILAIPDNQTISSQISVSNTYGQITDLNVRVGLTHTYIGDLKIWLQSPAGTVDTLFSRSCTMADNIETYFDDQGAPLTCTPGPVNGVFTIPKYPLSVFNGEDIIGTWTLYVQDNAGNDVGTLHEWCLEPTIESDCSEFSKTGLVPIRDLQTISDSIIVADTSGVILDLDVRVGITHTWIGDLDIWLESPSGTVVNLYVGQCGLDTVRFENIETYFNDEGSPLVCPPTSGVLTIPYDPLSALDGEPFEGTWKIYAHDYVSFDNGILNGWCLIPALGECVSSAQCDDGNPCSTDICQNNNACQNSCQLSISSVLFTANTITGCNDGTVDATITAGSCGTWTAYLLFANVIQRTWPHTEGASIAWTDIPPGNYLMVVNEPGGCADSTNIPIGAGVPCGLQISNPASTPTTVEDCDDGSINAVVNALVCDGQWTATLFDNLDNLVESWVFDEGSSILWEGLPSGNYKMIASDNVGDCAKDTIITVSSGPPCRVQVQNVQTTVVNCSNNNITADISSLTCDGKWWAYLYVSDYSSFFRTRNYTQSPDIVWTGIPLGDFHLLATDNAGCSDTVHITLSCSDGDPCTNDNCTGSCTHSFKCNDNNPCTEDFCQVNGDCSNLPINCDDGDPCTTDACVNGNCQHTAVNCADNNPCTVDQCLSGNCAHTPTVCNDGNACTNDYCQGGNCVFQPTCALDDNNLCTDDYCVNRNCLHVPVTCNDNYSCTQDVCIGGQCFYPTICVLDDSIPCTKDQCINGSCAHIDTCATDNCTINPGNCADNDFCTTDTCISNACVHVPKDCDDNVSCTDDQCSNGNCVNNFTCVLNDNNACTRDTCVNASCIHVPTVCNDNNACTKDTCQGGTCAFIPLCAMDDGNPCTTDFCLGGQCIHQDKVCNDGNLCTTDFCDSLGSCIYEPILCDDGDACTADSCLNASCIYPPIPNCSDPCDTMACDDGNGCTTDSCSNGTCINVPVDCDDGNQCTSDTCVNGNCQHTALGTCNLEISGRIATETGDPVPGVTVSLTGTGAQNFQTAANGLYNFDVAGGSYTVTPSKNNDSITNNGVSTLDIIVIRRQILSIQPMNSPYKIIAADVNFSESVSTLDIIHIRTVILQIAQSFPNGNLWAFVNSDFVIADSLDPFPFDDFRGYINISSNQTGQDFIGIKLGDVNESWNPNQLKAAPAGDVRFMMNEYNVMRGDEIIVPVKVRDFNKITGYQFTLSWDADIVKLLEVSNKSLSGFYGTHDIDNGILTTSWYDDMTEAVTLGDDETAFELKFMVVGDEGAQSEIKIGSEATASEAYNENLDLLNVFSANGMVKVGDAVSLSTHNSTPITLSVQPNPFTNTTNIIFTIPEDETVNIVIYDLIGKEIRHIHGSYKAGEHSIEWAGDDDSGVEMSKGLYHIRMVAGNHAGATKVVFAR